MQTAIIPPTRQKAFALFSARYPSQDHMGGPCLESRAGLGRQRCMYRLGDVYAQRSMPRLAPALGSSSGVHTCWLINKIAISFLSVVNLSKASSIAALSVLLSTTRKFFCESGGCVTCYISIRIAAGAKLVDIIHQFQLRGGQLLNPGNDISKKPGRSRTKKSLLHLRSRQGIVCLCRQRPVLPWSSSLFSSKLDSFSEMELYETWVAALRRHPASYFRANEAPL